MKGWGEVYLDYPYEDNLIACDWIENLDVCAQKHHKWHRVDAAVALRLDPEPRAGKPLKSEHLHPIGQLMDRMAARQQEAGPNP